MNSDVRCEIAAAISPGTTSISAAKAPASSSALTCRQTSWRFGRLADRAKPASPCRLRGDQPDYGRKRECPRREARERCRGLPRSRPRRAPAASCGTPRAGNRPSGVDARLAAGDGKAVGAASRKRRSIISSGGHRHDIDARRFGRGGFIQRHDAQHGKLTLAFHLAARSAIVGLLFPAMSHVPYLPAQAASSFFSLDVAARRDRCRVGSGPRWRSAFRRGGCPCATALPGPMPLAASSRPSASRWNRMKAPSPSRAGPCVTAPSARPAICRVRSY